VNERLRVTLGAVGVFFTGLAFIAVCGALFVLLYFFVSALLGINFTWDNAIYIALISPVLFVCMFVHKVWKYKLFRRRDLGPAA
jgi:hypothetical protein